jgi:hypothetical protein
VVCQWQPLGGVLSLAFLPASRRRRDRPRRRRAPPRWPTTPPPPYRKKVTLPDVPARARTFRRDWLQAVVQAVDDGLLARESLPVAQSFASFSDDAAKDVWPSLDTVGRRVDYSERSAARWKAELEHAGFLAVRNRWKRHPDGTVTGRSNITRFLIPPHYAGQIAGRRRQSRANNSPTPTAPQNRTGRQGRDLTAVEQRALTLARTWAAGGIALDEVYAPFLDDPDALEIAQRAVDWVARQIRPDNAHGPP